MDYFDDVILEKLPERRRPPPAVLIDRVSTHVEAYVRDEVEAVAPISMESPLLQEVMAALHKLNVPPPVTPAHLAAALKSIYTAARLNVLFKEYGALVPRLLKTLNGPAEVIVPVDILQEAARRERAVSMLPEGWGVYDPPVAATSWRLLVSAGLPPALLPSPPKLSRKSPTYLRLTAAWEAACNFYGWPASAP
jgi:hypothetical protein